MAKNGLIAWLKRLFSFLKGSGGAEQETTEEKETGKVPETPAQKDDTSIMKDPPSPPKDAPNIASAILTEARKYLDTPYLYGGNDPGKGFDCSGFVNYVFAQMGLILPRISSDQAREGSAVSASEAQAGDLVFFSHSGDQINHVGIVLSDAGEELQMIHASTSKGVIITNVDTSSYWKPRLRGIRRIIT